MALSHIVVCIDALPFMCLEEQSWAAWAQAILSALTLAGAYVLGERQASHQSKLAAKSARDERGQASIGISETLAVIIEKCHGVLGHFVDRLSSRDAVHFVAVEAKMEADMLELRALERAVGAIPLHSLPAMLVAPALVAGAIVRQFRFNVELALKRHRQMDAAKFSEFFDAIGDARVSIGIEAEKLRDGVEALKVLR